MIRTYCGRFFLLLLAAVICVSSHAAAASMEQEISHLLNFIRTSDCVFVRNSRRHDPGEAAEHIQKKYNYLKKRIRSTEDFIDGTATKSSLSGKPYIVICRGRELKTADWLRAELKKYRSQ
jgi:hypothetical protein